MLKQISGFEAQSKVNLEFTNYQFNLHWTDYEDTYFIVNLLKNRKDVLEVGTYLGYTTENILRNTECNVTTVDICKDIMDSTKFQTHEILDRSETGKMIGNWGDRVEKILSMSDNYFASIDKKFDAIFIDGDHSYEQVKRDSENAFKCIKPNGIIIWHDVYNMDTLYDLKRRSEPDNDGVVKYLQSIPQLVHKIDRSWVGFYIHDL